MKNRIIIFLSLLLFTSQIGCKAQICTKDDTLFIDNKKCGRLLYNKNGEKQEKALTKKCLMIIRNSPFRYIICAQT